MLKLPDLDFHFQNSNYMTKRRYKANKPKSVGRQRWATTKDQRSVGIKRRNGNDIEKDRPKMRLRTASTQQLKKVQTNVGTLTRASSTTPTPIINQQQDQQMFSSTVCYWFNSQFDEVRTEGSSVPDDELVQQTQKRAEELLSQEIACFSQSYRCQNRSDADWLDMVAKRGTFPDRLSALQLRIRRSAVYALPHLRQFVEMAKRKGAKIRQAHILNKALKELFLRELLPPNRKLLKFSQRPLEQWANSKKPEAAKRLLMWHFEAELKQLYHQFIEGLQSLAGNTAEGVALAACQDMAELLAERPEQEQQLLAALINKLGHPTHRVGAGVAQCLERTVAQQHPNMRSVLISEVETLMFRKNISPKAQRYAVHFLSRIILDAGETELALQLIRIYLKLFHILVAKDALADHPKLLPLLTSGLNRAFPYAKGRTSEVLDNVDSLYTIVQTAKFSTALSVLRLLFQIHSASDGLSDRFYAAFYRRLLNLQLGNQHQDTQLFTLAQQILRNDLVECRVRAFLKRFFQIALSANSAFAAAILLMCHSVVRERPQLIRVEWASNKGQNSVATIQRQLNQHKSNNKIPSSTEGLMKLNILKSTNQLEGGNGGGGSDQQKKEEGQGEEEEEEHYEDVQLSSDGEEDGTNVNNKKKKRRRRRTEEPTTTKKEEYDEDEEGTSKKRRRKSILHGWVHRRETTSTTLATAAVAVPKRENGLLPSEEAEAVSKNVSRQRQQQQQRRNVNGVAAKRNSYNPMVRNPLFAGAEWALDDELGTLAHHFHPTVASFAQALMKGQSIPYRGDPLIDLSQMRFLDRFAFKNPKKQRKMVFGAGGDGATTENAAASAGRPLFTHSYAPSGVKALNPTSQDYLSKKSSEIPLDERFLHHFATMKFQTKGKKGKKAEEEEDEVASLDSDEFDMLMERFEPGESREVFDVDFGTEFGKTVVRKDSKNKRALKRKRAASMNESDEREEDEDEMEEDDDDERDEEDDENEEEEDEDELDDDEEEGEDEDENDEDEDVGDEFEYDDEFDDDDDDDSEQEEEEELEYE